MNLVVNTNPSQGYKMAVVQETRNRFLVWFTVVKKNVIFNRDIFEKFIGIYFSSQVYWNTRYVRKYLEK